MKRLKTFLLTLWNLINIYERSIKLEEEIKTRVRPYNCMCSVEFIEYCSWLELIRPVLDIYRLYAI